MQCLFTIENPICRRHSSREYYSKEENKRKKKKKELLIVFDSHVDSIIETAANTLIKQAYSINYLDDSDISSNEWFQNNVDARESAKTVTPLSFEKQIISHENQCDFSTLTSYLTEEYILPARSTFHLSDVKDLHLLEDKFDLILLDPPWRNKSVNRKKGYYTMYLDSLLDLPIKKLCNPGCLIIVWVTNKKKQISFVEKELFQKWNVTSSVIWHWVKVTKKGHYVFPIDSQQKKPYENLLLGYVSSGEEKDKAHSKNLEAHKTIVSVPSSIHSHKPPLTEILQPYLPENPRCLEIFARYLLPKWTSIGNEVIKLQNTKLFDRILVD
ncbi:N(6)-adenine-specific methyltransferase METTL4 [Parasteatoda tepidariorum]|uniref:N(6)-adenine-specific methyltransferase METTL4 n=1 Tax=Parasteatoda tepidariorum TaxID=114398 RepID=UPI0039BC2478